MKNLTKLGLSVALCAGFAISTALADGSTLEGAKAMLKKGLAHFKEVGEEQALKDFNDPNGAYKDGELYMYCIGYKDNKMSSHPVNRGLVGVDFYTMRDVDGKLFGKEIIENSKTNGSGYVDYKWLNPITKKIGVKRAYYEKFNDNQVCAVGVYK